MIPIMKSFKKLFFILAATFLIQHITANKESVEDLIMQLSDAAQKLELSSHDIESAMPIILQDTEFDDEIKSFLITTLRFALTAAQSLHDEELIATIETHLSNLGELEIPTSPLTPAMTQY